MEANRREMGHSEEHKCEGKDSLEQEKRWVILKLTIPFI